MGLSTNMTVKEVIDYKIDVDRQLLCAVVSGLFHEEGYIKKFQKNLFGDGLDAALKVLMNESETNIVDPYPVKELTDAFPKEGTALEIVDSEYTQLLSQTLYLIALAFRAVTEHGYKSELDETIAVLQKYSYAKTKEELNIKLTEEEKDLVVSAIIRISGIDGWIEEDYYELPVLVEPYVIKDKKEVEELISRKLCYATEEIYSEAPIVSHFNRGNKQQVEFLNQSAQLIPCLIEYYTTLDNTDESDELITLYWLLCGAKYRFSDIDDFSSNAEGYLEIVKSIRNKCGKVFKPETNTESLMLYLANFSLLTFLNKNTIRNTQKKHGQQFYRTYGVSGRAVTLKY